VIIGPSGSDKEIIARNIHNLSQRVKNPFGIFNCRGSNLTQLEANLFGVEINNAEGKDSFKPGLLDKINGGTLFLDELVVAPPEFQARILKLVKEEAFARIGSTEKISINVRIIAGFPLNVSLLIESGKVSDELFCRLNANTIKILPLRSRKEDIQYLLDYFIEQAAKVHSTTPQKISSEALGLLRAYHWPGDVSQMKNMIDWIMSVSMSDPSDDGIITVDDLPKEIVYDNGTNTSNTKFIAMVSELPIREAREAFEREYILEQLKKFSGNVSQTAKVIGMERSAFHRKLRSLNIIDSKLFKIHES
jgi:two-component system nitrogen regulation response regulator NtrX